MNFSRHLALIVFILFLFNNGFSQIGGDKAFEFINLPSSARETGVGGNLITIKDDDVSLPFHNPSLLNPTMHNKFSAGTAIYFADLVFGNFNYVRDYGKFGTYQAGIQYMSYGSFVKTDDWGGIKGEFKASEYVFNIGGAYPYLKYSFGANLKFIYSHLDEYNSLGAALDVAAAYHDTAKMFTATLLLKNIGGQFKPYVTGKREPIPFEIQVGFSKRFKHLPFRIIVVMHNLQQWNLRYDDPERQNEGFIFGDTTATGGNNVADVFDNIFRHFQIGGELYIKKVVRIGFGYNHLRRQELKVPGKKGLAGFSFSLGIRIKQIDFTYARARYHAKNAINHFTVGVDINSFIMKKRSKTPPDNL